MDIKLASGETFNIKNSGGTSVISVAEDGTVSGGNTFIIESGVTKWIDVYNAVQAGKEMYVKYNNGGYHYYKVDNCYFQSNTRLVSFLATIITFDSYSRPSVQGLYKSNVTFDSSTTVDLAMMTQSLMTGSNIKKFYVSGDVKFDPSNAYYDTYLNLYQNDGTYAAADYPSGHTSNNKYFIDVTLKSEVKQNETTSNNWYPISIAGRQYANMTSGNVLPVYYSQYLTLNPSTGVIKANDYMIGNTSISATLGDIATILASI